MDHDTLKILGLDSAHSLIFLTLSLRFCPQVFNSSTLKTGIVRGDVAVSFKPLTSRVAHTMLSWLIALCSVIRFFRRFGGTCSLHL